MASATETNPGELAASDPAGPDPERLLDIAQAAELLNVPFGWLQVKVTRREVPHTRLGKHVRFTRDHLARIIAEGERSAESPATVAPVARSARRTRL